VYPRRPMAPSLSIVVPALDEAGEIGRLARHLAAVTPDVDVLVVDGGSSDDTVDEARAAGLRVVVSSRGRAVQMNAGAAATSGEHLLFLHADTRPPPSTRELIARTLADSSVALGAFRYQVDDRTPGMRFIEWGCDLRNRWLRTPYGDQGLFLRRVDFERLGGFAEMPILEDLDLVQRAKALGRVAVLDPPAVTSARKYRERGVLRTWVRHAALAAGYQLGWRPGL